MMGQTTRSESLFYYFRIEDHVPEDHLLRLIDRHIDFAVVRETLKASYSHKGRPSIDPEVLLRILLIGYLYGITSERRLVEDVGMHLAYRWFTGLGFDQEVPHHSTFSKNRHGRFQESPLFLELFERIVHQCMNLGLLKGVDLAVFGAAAIEAIGQIHADMFFMGVTGVHPKTGLTTGDYEEAAVKRALSHAAAETIVLASSEKLNAASPYEIVGLEEVSGLITERTANDGQLKPYQEIGISVTRA